MPSLLKFFQKKKNCRGRDTFQTHSIRLSLPLIPKPYKDITQKNCRLVPLMKEFPGDTSGNDLLAKTEDKEILFPSLGGESSLEKGITTHSSMLAWIIPWTEEPGGLQTTGWQRVVHD